MRIVSRIAPAFAAAALLITLHAGIAAAQETVTLQRTAPAEGTVVSFTRTNNTTLQLDVKVNGAVMQSIEQVVSALEQGEITVTKVADGKVMSAKIKVIAITASMTQNGVENKQTGPQSGKTYIATRGEDDKVTLANEDGSPASEDDNAILRWADALFTGDAQINALPQRELKVGESFDIPGEAANANAEANMTASDVKWKLVGVEDVSGRKAAVFEVTGKQGGEPQPGLKITINQKSTVKVCVTTSLPLSGDSTGPMVVSGGQPNPQGGSIDFDGNGTLTTKHKTTLKAPSAGGAETPGSGDGDGE